MEEAKGVKRERQEEEQHPEGVVAEGKRGEAKETKAELAEKGKGETGRLKARSTLLLLRSDLHLRTCCRPCPPWDSAPRNSDRASYSQPTLLQHPLFSSQPWK